jgi:three-Cys-motif partner protein
VRESGYWAEDKLFFWHRYVDITTTAMIGRNKWPYDVVYVDLFAGPGICIDRNSGRRFPGSPLIAANSPKPFSKILLCELSAENAVACRTRLSGSAARDRFELFVGDCNGRINEVVSHVPSDALTLGFIDPTGLHVHLSTVVTLADCGAVDLLILFPDAVDIIRNADHYYFDNKESNLDLVLGADSDWRARKKRLASNDGTRLRRLFVDVYKSQLQKHAGYTHFGEETISGPHGPLYRLVYVTKNELGLKFWNESIKKDSSGQKRLF